MLAFPSLISAVDMIKDVSIGYPVKKIDKYKEDCVLLWNYIHYEIIIYTFIINIYCKYFITNWVYKVVYFTIFYIWNLIIYYRFAEYCLIEHIFRDSSRVLIYIAFQCIYKV